MSVLATNFKPLRKAQSLPHITSRHDSGISSLTATTSTAPGSCSILDLIGAGPIIEHHILYNTNLETDLRQHHHHNHHHHNHHHHHHHHHPYEQQILYNTRLVDLRQLMTLRQHYYPEGEWGWLLVAIGFIIQCLSHGLHMSIGVLNTIIASRFQQDLLHASLIGSISICVALFISPITIALCHRKSTRLLAIVGGMITTLGCLFTSFAQQFHQLFFSYGIIVGLGVGMTRDCSTIMIAQYFKRKRELVEMFIVAGSGFGIVVMSVSFKKAITNIGWRLGLQCITATLFVTFILGLLYRSASLYHPQRRAILHLKNQRRKVKEKNRASKCHDFFDFKTLRSKTVRIILLSSAFTAFGIYIPIVHLPQQYLNDGLEDRMLLLQGYLGFAWMMGAIVFGLLVTWNTADCRIARQYLCQMSAFMCAICMLGLSSIKENFEGYAIIVWTYGFFCGAYSYSIKVYTYERVRARNFSPAWSFVQFSQSIPILIGTSFAEYLNMMAFPKAGYIFGFCGALIGSLLLFLVDVHKRNISRHKHMRSNGTHHLCISTDCPQSRKLSFTQEPDNEPAISFGHGGGALLLNSDFLVNQLSEEFAIEPNVNGNLETTSAIAAVANAIDKPELTCISEEGIADVDTPDNTAEHTIGECTRSCDKMKNNLREHKLKDDHELLTNESIDSQDNELIKRITISNNPDAIQDAAEI